MNYPWEAWVIQLDPMYKTWNARNITQVWRGRLTHFEVKEEFTGDESDRKARIEK